MQTHDPIVIRRDGVIRFIDWDFGFRDPHPRDTARLRGWLTRRTNQRAIDPILGDGGSSG